jgi:hypothetical protein
MRMTEAEIRGLVARLDTARTSDQDAAWERLRPLGEAVVPFLAGAFSTMKKWQGRAALVFHAIKYARANEAAFGLGLLACKDRSNVVRHRGCGLLAYSLKREALPHLEPLLKHGNPETVADARAAMDAIAHQNHHYFVDRSHSGRCFWQVGGAPNQLEE